MKTISFAFSCAQVFMAPIGKSLGQLGHSLRTSKHVRYNWGRRCKRPSPGESGWGRGLLTREVGRRGRAPSLFQFLPVNPKSRLECWIQIAILAWAGSLTKSGLYTNYGMMSVMAMFRQLSGLRLTFYISFHRKQMRLFVRNGLERAS
jgi:hypothetical protein